MYNNYTISTIFETPKKGAFLLTFDLTNLASVPTEAWLDVWIIKAGGIGGYPAEAAPVALVRGPELHTAGLLHAAQEALSRRAASFVGNPAIYDILVWALDELPGMLALPQTGTTARRKTAAAVAAAASAGGGGGGAKGVGGDEVVGSSSSLNGGRGGGGSGRGLVRPQLPGTEPLWSGGGGGGNGGGSSGSWRAGGEGQRGGRGGRGGGGGRQQQRQGQGGGGGLPPSERKRGRERVEASREFERRKRDRAGLPAAKAKADFLEMARRSQVVLVSGETGCGKTTQIPQFLLEEWEEGTGPDEFRVLVTQPRRIAAVGVAQRVADERCEKVGMGVGYKIRGESKAGTDTRLLFCTTGLLLRRMQGDPHLEELTHLVVDEVHERHLDADFLLALLIGILPKR